MLTRRNLLVAGTQIALMGGAGALVSSLPATGSLFNARAAGGVPPGPNRRGFSAMRLTTNYDLDIEPRYSHVVSRRVFVDDVLPVLEVVEGEAVGPNNNRTWFRTDGGFVHSSWVQLVNDAPNQQEPIPVIAAGFWGEVTVPWTQALLKDGTYARFYYSAVFRVVGLEAGPDGTDWYRVSEGIRGTALVPPRAIRRLTEADLAPISPGASKRIDLDLKTHVVRAYESDRQVWEARCASGDVTKRRGTPAGNFNMLAQFAGQHMVGAQGTPESYSLPGVPFVSYFTGDGVAFHGAYWHFDWGAQRTHGCVNLSPDDARWIWRWAELRRVNVGTSRRPRVVTAGTPVNVRQ